VKREEVGSTMESFDDIGIIYVFFFFFFFCFYEGMSVLFVFFHLHTLVIG
jgi:hypothetical protein